MKSEIQENSLRFRILKTRKKMRKLAKTTRQGVFMLSSIIPAKTQHVTSSLILLALEKSFWERNCFAT